MNDHLPQGKLAQFLDGLTGIRRLTDELSDLNTNLEVLQVQAAEALEVLRDLRTMAAPLLGWKVKEE